MVSPIHAVNIVISAASLPGIGHKPSICRNLIAFDLKGQLPIHVNVSRGCISAWDLDKLDNVFRFVASPQWIRGGRESTKKQ